MPRTTIRTILAAALLLCDALEPAGAREVPGLREVEAELTRAGSVGVFVSFKIPAGTGRDSARPSVRGEVHRSVQSACLDPLEAKGTLRSRYRYRYSPSAFVEITSAATLSALAADPRVRALRLDEEGRVALDETRPAIGADRAEELGWTGAGVVIAILDTGIRPDHPDVANAVLHEYHFNGEGRDVGPGASDGNGHGTHVSGIITSDGIVTPRGLAPEAELVIVRVFDASGIGSLSDWIAGLEHVIELHESGEQRVDLINLSFATTADFALACDDEFPAFHAAAARAHELGITLFAATGNRGRIRVSAPACYSEVVAVGSVSLGSPPRVSSFSNRTQILELLAPGEMVRSAGAGRLEETRTGTSQATAHATGIAALLKQADPTLSPRELREILAETGDRILDSATGETFPSIRAVSALAAVVPPFLRGDCDDNASLSLGDVVHTLDALFVEQRDLDCRAACDANADDALNVSDAVFSLLALFRNGPPWPAPYPDCGPAASLTSCESSSCASL